MRLAWRAFGPCQDRPFWVALTAGRSRADSAAAWPLAVGVALGDLVWPLAAILGLTWIESYYGDFLSLLRWAAAVIFVVMGMLLIRKPAASLAPDSRLTRPGLWAGFSVGVAAVVGNPKAILFYMARFPGSLRWIAWDPPTRPPLSRYRR